VAPEKPDNLVDFNGRGIYRAPEFTWNNTVGVTALTFLNSDKYGKEYENDLFVATWSYGDLYHFDLTKDRTGLDLKSALTDKLGNTYEEMFGVILDYGSDLGHISDICMGPDGYLYIVSYDKGEIYRLIPRE